MPRALSQTGLSATLCRGPQAGGVEDRKHGLRLARQDAVARSDPGSSGKCRFGWLLARLKRFFARLALLDRTRNSCATIPNRRMIRVLHGRLSRA